MARNKLAGSKDGKSETARYYQENPEARKKKNEYSKKYNARPDQVKYRQELNKANLIEWKQNGNKMEEGRQD